MPKDDTKRMQNISLMVLILVLVGGLVYSYFFSTGISFDFSEEQMTVTDPGGNANTVAYRDITDIQLIRDADFGTCVSGGDDKLFKYGVWENGAWGQYDLCVSVNSSYCIAICSDSGTLVISYEDSEITQALYEELRKLWLDQNADT